MERAGRALVSGGAGFLGSHICRRLLQEGLSVICMDNLLTGRLENVGDLIGGPGFRFVNYDVTDYLHVEEPLDYVLHFASPASPVDYLRLPIQTLKVGSLGTHKALGLAKAKGATFLLASTSEVYGDPQVHPQTEDYWGHVNPIGLRGVYDEAKRFAEAMTMAYHRVHGLEIRIARIFNSILADQTVVLFNDKKLHIEPISRYVNSLESRPDLPPPKILVPGFDPKSCRVSLNEVSAVIKHPCQSDCYALSLRYGRKVKVTGDHSVFTSGPNARPTPIPVRQLRVGDYIAVPGYFPVVERDVEMVRLGDALIQKLPEDELWDYAVQDSSLRPIIERRREEIIAILAASGRFQAKRMRNTLTCATRKYWRQSTLPLSVLKRLGVPVPEEGKVRVFRGGSQYWLPAIVEVTPDLLWLIGFFIAEGSSHYKRGKSAFLTFSSDDYLLRRAGAILTQLGCHVLHAKASRNRAPAIVVHSRLLYFLFDGVFDVIREKRFPTWILQLPLGRLKYVLEGYREGDGTHSGKKLGRELSFDTTSEQLAIDLTYLLLRFAVVASVGEYTTTFRQKYGDRRFPFYRLTVCEVDNFDILTWDQGVRQTLNARKTGDLVWSRVNRIERCEPTGYVYDFSVPGKENFVAGNGVFCHNTYGPAMRLDDGRVVSNFVTQALSGQPLTVYGEGEQTRSFCYVDDMVEGVVRLLRSDLNEPVNLGNPEEHTVLELANVVKKVTGSDSPLEFHPLPQDDPQVRQPEISRARSHLGWEPAFSLEEGLRKTVADFRVRLGEGGVPVEGEPRAVRTSSDRGGSGERA